MHRAGTDKWQDVHRDAQALCAVRAGTRTDTRAGDGRDSGG
jgi:hypothetical protein